MAGYLHTVPINQVVFQKPAGKTASMLRSKKVNHDLGRIIFGALFVALLLFGLFYFWEGRRELLWLLASIPLLIYLVSALRIVFEPLPLVRYGTVIEHRTYKTGSALDNHKRRIAHTIKIRLDDTGELIHDLNIREPFQTSGLDGMPVVLVNGQNGFEIFPSYGLNPPVWNPAPVPVAAAVQSGGYEVTLPEVRLDPVPSDLRKKLRNVQLRWLFFSGIVVLLMVCAITFCMCLQYDYTLIDQPEMLTKIVAAAGALVLLCLGASAVKIISNWPVGVPVTILKSYRSKIITFRVEQTGQIVSEQQIERSYCGDLNPGMSVVFVQIKRGKYYVCPLNGKLK